MEQKKNVVPHKKAIKPINVHTHRGCVCESHGLKKSTWIPVRPGISLLNQSRYAVNVEVKSGDAQE